MNDTTLNVTASEKIKSFFRSNLPFLMSLVAGVVYIFKGCIEINKTGKEPLQILADGAVTMLFGYFISSLLSAQGLQNGEKNEKVINTNRLYGIMADSIAPKIELLDGFCERKTNDAIKKAQTKLLKRLYYTYDEFEQDRYHTPNKDLFISFEDMPKDKQKFICKVRDIKITPLVSSSLTTDDSKVNDPYNFGKSKRQYSTYKSLKGIVSKVVLSIFFGLYYAKPLIDGSTANLVWSAIQVAIFFLMGTLNYANSYFFITDEHRESTIKKINILQEFMNENGLKINTEATNNG